jgi:hypothetical protein
MTPAEQISTLDFLVATEVCPNDKYYDVYHGRAKDYVLVPSMLSQQISAIRNMFAEWPSLLLDVIALALEARTGTPTTKWQIEWRHVSENPALKRAGDGIVRLAAFDDSNGERMSAYVSRDEHGRKGLPPPANPDIWEAARRVKRGCIWMLAGRGGPEIRDILEALKQPRWLLDGQQSSAALWAIAQFFDADAVDRLTRLIKLPEHAGRRKVLRGYIDAIEASLGSSSARESRGTRIAKNLANSGYVIAESMARALSLLSGRSEDLRSLASLLIDAEGPRPSNKWLDRWRALRGQSVDPIMQEALVGIARAYNEITTVRPLISMPELEAAEHFYKTGEEQPGNPAARGIAQRILALDNVRGSGVKNIDELCVQVKNAARGAHWALASSRDPSLCDLWAHTVVAWSRMGDSTPVVAFAAIHALSQTEGDDAIVRLQELRARIKHKNLAKRIEAAFAAIASAQGLSADELADRLAPDHDLDASASREWKFGEHRMTLSVEADGQVRSHLLDSSGKTVKNLPADIVKAHENVLAEARAERKALAATVSLQRSRLEVALVSRRRWSIAAWLLTLGKKPVLSNIAQRLVWSVESDDETAAIGMPTPEHGWVNIDGEPLAVPPNATLSLVHPIDLSPDDQSAWQRRIVELDVVQPFKQIFRETYFPTANECDALEVTRYRGHIVPLSLLRALTVGRGWVGGLGLAGFDGSGQGTRSFDAFGVQAWLYHDWSTESDEARIETTEFRRTTESTTGRLGAKIRIADVPPLVFSEAMRDVDLVASVGSVGEGELGVPAAASEALASAFGLTRSPVIAALISSLGLRARVVVDGTYARVDGRYAVHLGTGAVTGIPSGLPVKVRISRRIARGVRLPFEDKDDAVTILINEILTLAGHD